MSFNIEAETRRLALDLANDLTALVCQSALELVQEALFGATAGLNGAPSTRVRRSSPPAEAVAVSPAVRTSVNRASQGKLDLDPDSRTVKVGRQEARLTRTEFRVFAYLAQRLGEWVPSDEIRSKVLGQRVSSSNRVDQPLLRVHVSNIRRKLGRSSKILLSDRTRGLKLALE